MIHYYQLNDIAKISSPSCEGCGECCRGMGESIELDPYDSFQLAEGLGARFADLINNEIALHSENGIILPHIVMKDGSDACSFLNPDGRCSIHSFRPGICRLYPLSRKYTEDGIRYFIQPDACSGHSLVKVKIRNYLQIQEYGKYDAFKWNWFHFLKDAEAAVVSDTDVSSGTKLGFFVLETFFLRPYDGGDFYSTVDKRIKRARHYLGL